MSTSTGTPTLAAVLRGPNYGIYTTGNAISLIGTWVQRVATGWLTWELTGSGFWLGLIAFADLAPTVLIGPIGGAVADRTDRLRLMRISQIVLLVLALMLFGLAVTGLIGIWSLFVLTLLSGIVAAFNQPARLALISSLVPGEQLPGAVAINSIVFNVARFVGPAVAGLAIVTSGVALAFAINALSFAVFVVALSRLRPEAERIAPRAPTGIFADLGEGLRYARGHVGLSALFILMAATCIGARPVVELLPGFADAVFGAGAMGLAVLTSSIGLGAVAGGLWLGMRPRPARLPGLMVASAILLSLALLAFVSTEDLWLAMAAMLVCGFAIACTGISSQTTIHLAVDQALRGRILSIHGVIFRGGPALGALAMGSASEFLGLRLPLAIGAVIVVVAALWMVLRLDRVKKALGLDDSGRP